MNLLKAPARACEMTEVQVLREEWKTLYSKTLPQLAKARDPAQTRWPVTLDHCFARIILDNTVGEGSRQWDKIIKKPAVKTMTASQLQDAIDLGTKIQNGVMNLCELDQISLMCRGKNEGKYGVPTSKDDTSEKPSGKRAHDAVGNGASKRRKRSKQPHQTTLPFASSLAQGKQLLPPSSTSPAANNSVPSDVDFEAVLDQIRSSSITPYRKRLYTILLSVPQGRHTTYAAMSEYLNSSARAVGNGMRNNPFAPDVPCHRVLAADRTLGGFKGDWGREGRYANDKVNLLTKEGVRFDSKGKVVGEPFRNFHEFEGL
jgi:O-6-methylguanine DNA methyltransferase